MFRGEVMSQYSHWILVGGGLQLAVLIASGLVPGVLDWRNELRKLPLLLCQLIWVHGAFIVLTIAGLGVISLVNSHELATGSSLARSVCAFIAIFWGTRLTLQWFCFAPDEYLRSMPLKLGYHLLTVTFFCLTIIYAWGAIHPIVAIPS